VTNNIVLGDLSYLMTGIKSLINHQAAVPISPVYDDVRVKLELNSCSGV